MRNKRLIDNNYIYLLIRIAMVSIIAIVTLQLTILFIGGKKEVLTLGFKEYFIVVIVFNVMSELQIGFDRFVDKFLPIPQKLNPRIFSYFGFAVVLCSLMFLFTKKIFQIDNFDAVKSELYLGLLLNVLFINGIISYLIFRRVVDQLIFSERKISAITQEKLMMSYNSLKDQLNPHYLFNNLSVLRALINTDQKAASKFTEDFAEVYRYVLESNEKQLVWLEEEIEFIDAYIDLHKIRLKTGLIVEKKIEPKDLKSKIAPLTLQLLIENAIKHNITSKDTPLNLSIKTADNKVIVTNNIQKKKTTYSTSMGLKNLTKRYEILGAEGILIEESETEFKVSVPLL